jgi:cysteine desulfurase
MLAAWDEGWADPSRLYREARHARNLLELARASVAEALGARPDEVFFARSGTDAAHLAVLGTLRARRRSGRRLVTSAIEHSCVLHAAEMHEAEGGLVDRLPADRAGRIALPDRFPPDTALVSLQSGNQEIGTCQDLAAIAERCHVTGVPWHVNAAQTVGRLPVSIEDWGADLLTASAHKFGGPPGVGILVTRTGTRWQAPLPADERGHHRVPGFENLPAIVATAAALQARRSEMTEEAARLAAFTEQVRMQVPRLVPDVELHGPEQPSERLPHIVSLSFLYVDGERLLEALDAAGLAVSSGSACTASSVTPSHVLSAVGALTHGNLRVSFGRDTTQADVDRLLTVLPDAVERLRAEAGVAQL